MSFNMTEMGIPNSQAKLACTVSISECLGCVNRSERMKRKRGDLSLIVIYDTACLCSEISQNYFLCR